MKIAIESTDQITQLDGVPVRVWRGTTEGDVPCLVFVHRIAVANGVDQSQFDAELVEKRVPFRFVPLSHVLG